MLTFSFILDSLQAFRSFRISSRFDLCADLKPLLGNILK